MEDGKDGVVQIQVTVVCTSVSSNKLKVMRFRSRDHLAALPRLGLLTTTMSDGEPSNVSKHKSHRKEKRLLITSLNVS